MILLLYFFYHLYFLVVVNNASSSQLLVVVVVQLRFFENQGCLICFASLYTTIFFVANHCTNKMPQKSN